MADGSVAKRSIGRVIEIREEWLVENKLWDGQVVFLSGHQVLEFVLWGELIVSAEVTGKVVVSSGFDGPDLGPGHDGVADFVVVNNEVGDLDDGVDLLWLLLVTHDILRSNVLLNIVGQGQIHTWNLDADGLLNPVSRLEFEHVLNGLAGQVLPKVVLWENKDGVLVLAMRFEGKGDCVEHLVLIHREVSDDFKGLDISGPVGSLELFSADWEEFMVPVVGVVVSVEDDGLGVLRVEGWNIWHKSIHNLVMGGDSDMGVDEAWGVFGEEEGLLVKVEAREARG